MPSEDAEDETDGDLEGADFDRETFCERESEQEVADVLKDGLVAEDVARDVGSKKPRERIESDRLDLGSGDVPDRGGTAERLVRDAEGRPEE